MIFFVWGALFFIGGIEVFTFGVLVFTGFVVGSGGGGDLWYIWVLILWLIG